MTLGSLTARARSSRFRLVAPLVLVAALVLALAGSLGVPSTPATAADINGSRDQWWNPPNRPAQDSQINATGEPFRGTDENGEVRGWVDSHNHVNSNEGFGGRLICGKPFDEAGIGEALKDCPDHYPNGNFALFENLTSDSDWTHDPVGWPTFADWPRVESMSHQAGYYAWIERAWRSGQRVMVNNLVSNRVICELPVLAKDRGCNEMDSIRLQAQKAYEMEAYIDGIYGGEGKGFFRIVTSPQEATEVIKSGRLAVVLGVETSEPFGCRQILDVAQCSKADIDRGLDEMQELGVSSMFLCHKFDNALCGVRFDPGTLGTIINAGQFLGSGTWWQTEQCRTPMSDNQISSAPPPPEVAEELPPGSEPPTYTNTKQCNVRGLTSLGQYALEAMMQRNMIVELDHMSAKAAMRSIEVLEAHGYPGVISSHGWTDWGFAERIYRLGGFLTSYPGSPQGFVNEWAQHKELRAKYDKGYGFGLDYNGIGSHPGPQGEDSPHKVTYPYTAIDGTTVMDKQVTGERTWNVNTDGVSHYGLVPDWISQVVAASGGEITEDLMSGAQSYLDMWGAAGAYTQPTNLALGGKLTQASSQEWTINNRLQAKSATDGNRSTRWAGGDWNQHLQWIRVDLGAPTTVGRVTVDWEAAFAKSYEVQVSDDASTWTTVWKTTSGDGGLDTAMFDPLTTRWIRVLCTEKGTKHGYSIWELGAYGQ